MLEAFQASTHAPSESNPPAAGPMAPSAPSKRAKSPSIDELASGLQREGGRSRVEQGLAIGAGALLLVLAFFLGRFSVGDPTQAAAPVDDDGAYQLDLDASERPIEAPVRDGAGAANDTGRDLARETGRDVARETAPAVDEWATDADRAFRDTANRVTVCAQRYGPDEQTRWEQDYFALLDAGLPVVQPFADKSGKWIVLCVGARPRIDGEIESLLERVQSMRAFESAYIDNIANVTRQ